MEVGNRCARLPPHDNQRGSFGRPDRQGCRLVDEILVAAESIQRVTGKAFDGLLLLADWSRNGEVAIGEGRPIVRTTGAMRGRRHIRRQVGSHVGDPRSRSEAYTHRDAPLMSGGAIYSTERFLLLNILRLQ